MPQHPEPNLRHHQMEKSITCVPKQKQAHCLVVDTGECELSLSPTATMLRKHGIRPILNYAAEDDVSSSPAQVRCADTAAELICDRNMLPFLKSIADSGNREGKGFIQAKVSHMCNFADRVRSVADATCIQC